MHYEKLRDRDGEKTCVCVWDNVMNLYREKRLFLQRVAIMETVKDRAAEKWW